MERSTTCPIRSWAVPEGDLGETCQLPQRSRTLTISYWSRILATVSLELLTRDSFVPATTLNLLAAAWLQFMIRGWFSHGNSPKENPWLLPLKDEDPWHEHPMRILRTAADPTRTDAESGLPPTFINTESCWWDASQIYGSSKQFQDWARAGQDGKLNVTPNGDIPLHPDAQVQAALGPGLVGWFGTHADLVYAGAQRHL